MYAAHSGGKMTTSKSKSTKDHEVHNGDVNGNSWGKEKASLERELEDLNNSIVALNSPAVRNNLNIKPPEMEMQLYEKKSICLLKLKKYEQVVEEGYRIIGKRGPSSVVYKCVIVALCWLGKYDDVWEVMNQWGKLSPKDVVMADSKQKVERFLSAVRSGMNPTEVFQTIEQALGLHSEWVYKKSLTARDNWKFRPPPRFATAFFMCSRGGQDSCLFGDNCIGAHSQAELAEWKMRLELRNKSWEKARSTVTKPSSSLQYLIDITKRIQETTNIRSLLADDLQNVKFRCAQPLKITTTQKGKENKWSMLIVSKVPVRTVALLHDVHRHNFWISAAYYHSVICRTDIDLFIIHEVNRTPKLQVANTFVPSQVFLGQLGGWPDWFYYKLDLSFNSNVYGSFRQTIMFDLKTDPKLVKHLSVELVAETTEPAPFHADPIVDNEPRVIQSPQKINLGSFEVVDADAGLHVNSVSQKFMPDSPPSNILNGTEEVRRDNYIAAMGRFIEMEQKARQDELSKCNITASLEVTSSYTIERNFESLLKCSWQGQLYAKLNLAKEISEDTKLGRLIIRNCQNVLLLEVTTSHLAVTKPRGYVCKIADKMKSSIVISVGQKAVQELNLVAGTSRNFVVQFLLDDRNFQEMRTVLESISDTQLDILFPDLGLNYDFSSIIGNSTGVFFEGDFTLNERQLAAYNAITCLEKRTLPPFLLIGPFGTGKTYTLAQCLKKLLSTNAGANSPRILVCTHSNSAADLYILNYLHQWFEEGMRSARPLRIYFADRMVQTVPHVVKKYCLLTGDGMNFRYPTKEEVLDHQIVIVTLSTSTELLDLGLNTDTFTHILLDEAAQALETEAIQPLMLAGPNTKIVLAGDHMQLSPELFSTFSQGRAISLLERLNTMYYKDHPCRIVLTENYRSHEVILRFASEAFYGGQLRCASLQPCHPSFYPISFFAVRGEDVLPDSGASFYNMAEVFEVTERILELVKTWPEQWGNYKADNSIAVLTPYADQVTRIRAQLRVRNLGFVTVERVLNVQGKQFRVVIVSTVRTHKPWLKIEENMDLGFLSNPKLLNTALTRAQSMFAVVGDPVSLCAMGKCRNLWDELVTIAAVNSSFFGMNHAELKQQLLALEMKTTFGYNPLATAFVGTATLGNNQQVNHIGHQPTSHPPIHPASKPLYLKGFQQSPQLFASTLQNHLYQPTQTFAPALSFDSALPSSLVEESSDEKEVADVLDKLLFPPEVASLWSNNDSGTDATGVTGNKNTNIWAPINSESDQPGSGRGFSSFTSSLPDAMSIYKPQVETDVMLPRKTFEVSHDLNGFHNKQSTQLDPTFDLPLNELNYNAQYVPKEMMLSENNMLNIIPNNVMAKQTSDLAASNLNAFRRQEFTPPNKDHTLGNSIVNGRPWAGNDFQFNNSKQNLNYHSQSVITPPQQKQIQMQAVPQQRQIIPNPARPAVHQPLYAPPFYNHPSFYAQAFIRNVSPVASISSSETSDPISSGDFPTLIESAAAPTTKAGKEKNKQAQTQGSGHKATNGNGNQNNNNDEWVQVRKKKTKTKDAAPIPSGEEKIELLISMGFEKKKAIRALQRTNRNLDEAIEWLLSKSTPQNGEN